MSLPRSPGKVLGILKPMGGGDPIPLLKAELVIGRRPSNDICLDFHNISGKHCKLRLINSVWHVRDLGSTNGTSVNGLQLTSEHNVLPDDELKIATHLFTIDYEPGGPDSVLQQHSLIADVVEEHPHRHSLLELAGIDTDEDKPKRRARSSEGNAAPKRSAASEPAFDDEIPEAFKAGPAPKVNNDDDDFLKLIEEDVKKADDRSKRRK
jgi:FHA domain